MLPNLFLALLLTVVSVVVHLAGLFALLHFLRRNARRVNGALTRPMLLRQFMLMVVTALGIFAIHFAEIWLYAIGYVSVGALEDFTTALYFSASSYSTLGYGDVVLSPNWRLFSAFEGVTGLVLIGWSSAFLLSVTSRLRVLEHDWDSYEAK